MCRVVCPCQVMVVNANKAARSLAFAFRSPDSQGQTLPPSTFKSLPLALSNALGDTFYPSTAVPQHTKQKSAGMANFSCIWYSGYSASTHDNPGEQERRGEKLWRWITRSRHKRSCYEQAAISQESTQSEWRVWGEEYGYSFAAKSLFSCQQKNTVYQRCQTL